MSVDEKRFRYEAALITRNEMEERERHAQRVYNNAHARMIEARKLAEEARERHSDALDEYLDARDKERDQLEEEARR